MIFVPGAGFYGHSGSSDFALDAALMARSTGRPVRSLWQRQDEPLHAPLNPAMKTKMTARLDVNGRIVAYDALVTSSPHSTRPAGLNELNLRAQQFISKPRSTAPGNDAQQPQGGADRNAVPGYAISAVQVVRQRPAYVPYRTVAMRGLGAFTQAISWSLKEEISFAGGQNLTQNWDDYPILKFSEVPCMQTRLIGPQDAPPLGAGEISSGPAGAAVVNTVRHVLGVVTDRLPLSRHAFVALLS